MNKQVVAFFIALLLGSVHSYPECHDRCNDDNSGILYECWEDGETSVGLRKRCGVGYECGKCEYDVYNERVCRCINSAKPPPFPSTGTLTWKGMARFESYGQEDEQYPLKGVFQITSDGQYLLKMIEIPSGIDISGEDPANHQKISIILPNTDGTFTEYNGDGSGTCTKTTTRKDNRKKLDWIWRYLCWDNPKNYELQWKEANVQKWGVKHDYNTEAMGSITDDRSWSMVLEGINSDSKVVVPKKFYHSRNFESDSKTVKVYFKYRPAEETSFRLADYCDDQ